MRQAFRIVREAHAATAFTGAGAALHGGRWNSPGARVVYTSASASLAALETLVHLNPAMRFRYVIFSIEFDERRPPASLPVGGTNHRHPPPNASAMSGSNKPARRFSNSPASSSRASPTSCSTPPTRISNPSPSARRSLSHSIPGCCRDSERKMLKCETRPLSVDLEVHPQAGGDAEEDAQTKVVLTRASTAPSLLRSTSRSLLSKTATSLRRFSGVQRRLPCFIWVFVSLINISAMSDSHHQHQ